MSKHIHSYLALGDSYTIGESVPIHESFPYQAVQMMRKKGYSMHAAEIVARTGWTTFELAEHCLHTQLLDHYDFVSLLIGVNNQYRGLPFEEFKHDFTFLMQKAIHFAKDVKRVVAFTIPDWGVTPFAHDRNRADIAKEIDAMNAFIQIHCKEKLVHCIEITSLTRTASSNPDLLAKDQLHYSGKAHQAWAEQMVDYWLKVV